MIKVVNFFPPKNVVFYITPLTIAFLAFPPFQSIFPTLRVSQCIYFADTKEEFYPMLPSYDERTRLVCENPIAGARFFDFMVTTFLTDVLGIQSDNREGFYGPTSGYYGTIEQQGRLMLHLHMLLWIVG